MPAPKGRSKSAKKPSPLDVAKEEISRRQIQIDDLTNQITELKESINKEVAEEQRLRLKLQTIIPEIIAHRDRDKFPLEPIANVTEIDEGYVREMVQVMVDDLRGRQSHKNEIEERVEELEQRITEQNTDYQSILRQNLACMDGVGKALNLTSPHEVKFLLRRLKQDLLLEEPVKRPMSAPAAEFRRDGQLFNLTQLPPTSEESPIPNLNTLYLRSMETSFVSAPRPIRKYSGDTLIKHMQEELKEAICNELNVESSHRGDWRHFAHLVGIGTETIQFWRRLGLRNPMDNVLSFWKDSHVATVLALHRILITDQVGAMSLAKLVSEFYHVD